jgi:hypothetical protein
MLEKGITMSLIIYMPKANDSSRRLLQMIAQLEWQDSIEIFYHFGRLLSRLRHPSGDEDIALFCASTVKDLEALVANEPLLNNMRLILILPDREAQTISKGHLLRPRFMCYLDGDFSDLALVLKKMEKNTVASPHSIESEFVVPRGGAKPHPPSFPVEGRSRKTSKRLKGEALVTRNL